MFPRMYRFLTIFSSSLMLSSFRSLSLNCVQVHGVTAASATCSTTRTMLSTFSASITQLVGDRVYGELANELESPLKQWEWRVAPVCLFLLEFLCGLWVQLPSRLKTTEEQRGELFICGPESKLVFHSLCIWLVGGVSSLIWASLMSGADVKSLVEDRHSSKYQRYWMELLDSREHRFTAPQSYAGGLDNPLGDAWHWAWRPKALVRMNVIFCWSVLFSEYWTILCAQLNVSHGCR